MFNNGIGLGANTLDNIKFRIGKKLLILILMACFYVVCLSINEKTKA